MEVENHNGTLMREFLERDNMVAVNTTSPRASGKTWHGGRKAATRGDYVLVDAARIHQGDYAVLGRELHRRLRTLVGLEIMDISLWHGPSPTRHGML